MFLPSQCCDVVKVGYIIALFISHRRRPLVWLFGFIRSLSVRWKICSRVPQRIRLFSPLSGCLKRLRLYNSSYRLVLAYQTCPQEHKEDRDGWRHEKNVLVATVDTHQYQKHCYIQ